MLDQHVAEEIGHADREPEVAFSISSATLALLAEENAQLKDDIERRIV